MKRRGWLRILAGALVLAALWFVYFHAVRPLVLVAGALASPTLTKEVRRVESPDHEIAAVVIRGNPGALEPYYYDVYLTPQGSRDLGKPVLDAFGEDDLKLRWIGPKLLVISYSQACIANFHNHWNSMEIQNGLYDVEIRLNPPDDPTPRQPCS